MTHCPHTRITWRCHQALGDYKMPMTKIEKTMGTRLFCMEMDGLDKIEGSKPNYISNDDGNESDKSISQKTNNTRMNPCVSPYKGDEPSIKAIASMQSTMNTNNSKVSNTMSTQSDGLLTLAQGTGTPKQFGSRRIRDCRSSSGHVDLNQFV
ncbi:hypothetical protein HAX54_020887 [Datura stramonium]|uniref:Uncharacterized protein n=1 Tax=Datura stramonium TaxID=4076 RepID=A0ABS8UTR8_DATST|nr:hypothetical protein [Datura stramonium]